MALGDISSNTRDQDEGKDDGRLTQYKNLTKHEELRRRRTECSVEIRKQKGAEMMMKRRNITEVDEDCNSESELEDTSISRPLTSSERMTHDEIKSVLSNNPSEEDMERCFIALRKSLSKSKNPPIDEVVKSGLMQALIAGLSVENIKVQYEAAWALTNIVSGTTEQTLAAVKCGATEPLVRLSVHKDQFVAEQSLWAVANIAGDSAQLRDHVLQCHGAEALMHLMTRVNEFTASHVRTIAWAFSNMVRHKNPNVPIEVLRELCKGLMVLIQHKDRQVKQDACWAVSYLTDGPDEQIELARESGILEHIAGFLEDHESLTAPALRTLGNVATGNDSLTQAVIDLGTLGKIKKILADVRSTSIVKECCWLLSNIIAGTQGQIQAVIDAGLIYNIIRIYKIGDHKCKFEASWALSNLAQGGTARQILTIDEEGGVQALVHALNECNTDLLNNALETLYTLCLTVQSSFPDRLDALLMSVEEYGGLDALEKLQESQSEQVYSLAYRIVSQFFSGDDDNQALNPEDAENNAAPLYDF